MLSLFISGKKKKTQKGFSFSKRKYRLNIGGVYLNGTGK